ncbi:MAG: flagellar M-ring protein FliF [Spirochaetaceae bacterium]|jgi:flagellar M-ring protein FliF|nr:flagellar M-ring protein FliF [Spirochaetaceae bacterium]
MNAFFQKVVGWLKAAWGTWSMMQKLILAGIVAAALIGVVALVGVSSKPTIAPVIDAPIADETARNQIVTRINQEGVKTFVSASGVVSVEDEETARKMRSILIREDLIPQGTDPWAIFDRDRWTITDFERDVNFRRSITAMVTAHIKSLDDVDNANVTIVMPERTLFAADQNPVTATVILTPRPGSDIRENKKKIEGVQKIVKFAVEGLADENIVITDSNGLVLNDFEGMADYERVGIIEREQKLIQKLEASYRAQILKQLQTTFSEDRVRDLAIKIDMDMSKKEIETNKVLPYERRPRTPGLSYDDSEIFDSVLLSETRSTTSWEGTGFNPEGPAGVEGQTPPALKDMSNLVGKVTQETVTHNEQLSTELTKEERTPQIDRVTVSVNIDGVWKRLYDEKGNVVIEANGTIGREYVPLTPEQIRGAETLIQNAVGYNAARSDSVTVQNIAFDREAQFAEESAVLLKQKQFRLTMIIALAGIALFFVGFLVVKAILRAQELKRQREDAERARQAQLRREAALLEAEREGVEANLSAEDRAFQEIIEKATALAREKPADVSQLIRTWIMEE